MLNGLLSNTDTMRYFLTSCPSEVQKDLATAFGNLAWAGIADGNRAVRESAVYALGFTAVTGIGLLLAKNSPFKKRRIMLFALSLVASAVTMNNLYHQAMQLQAFSNGWDSQYPNFSLSSIINLCNKE